MSSCVKKEKMEDEIFFNRVNKKKVKKSILGEIGLRYFGSEVVNKVINLKFKVKRDVMIIVCFLFNRNWFRNTDVFIDVVRFFKGSGMD